jgi:hypothetical protein
MVLERVITPQIPPNPLRVIAHGRELSDRLNNDMKRYSQVHVEQKRLAGIRGVLTTTLAD